MHTCQSHLRPQTVARGARSLQVGLSLRFDDVSTPALRTESVVRSQVVRHLSVHGIRKAHIKLQIGGQGAAKSKQHNVGALICRTGFRVLQYILL